MIKRQSEMRREQTAHARGGEGITVFDHILEKTEIRTNCHMFSKMTLETGVSIGYHHHEKEEDIYYVLSGVATVCDDGETRTVYPGEVVYTGSGSSHSIANNGTTPLEVISIILTYETPER